MPNGGGNFFVIWKARNNMDDLIAAFDRIADTSFYASNIEAEKFGDNRIAARRSGSTKQGFYRPGERSESGAPFEVLPTKCPEYYGPPSGRAPTGDEKRGAWQLQEEYLAVRLGKNAEENSRLWNTAIWINRHYAVTKTPSEALPPLNIYVGDKISQSIEGTGAPTGPDDEAPDEAENEGTGFESINVGHVDDDGNGMCVMDEDGTTRLLDIKTDDYELLRLIDALKEVDDFAKIDVNDLKREAPPLLPQTDFPGDDQRVESGKIIRMLMLGMRSLWHPVIRAIADHATMTGLGKTQGKGDKVAAAVGRQRVIEGLRIAESIRKRLQQITQRQVIDEASYWPARKLEQRRIAVIDGFIGQVLTAVAGNPLPIPANDNRCVEAIALAA
jgi:hypothetical protein